MALTSLDERDLLLPLYQGIHETPVWETFLRRLLARSGATQVSLLLRAALATDYSPLSRTLASNPALAEPDFERLTEAGLMPMSRLRPNRVYALEEMFDAPRGDAAKRQREALKRAQIAHARFIRIVARGDHNAWLVLLHDRKPFAASDSALLSAIAPHLASALATLAELGGARLRAAMAEDALGLLGIGQIALDRDGRVLAGDGLATRMLDVTSANRLPIPGTKARDLARACGELSGKTARQRQLVRIDSRDATDMLLRPCSEAVRAAADPVTVIGAIRRPQRAATREAHRTIARLLGLSDREAALANAIAHGQSIIEAGAALQLTQETARNYTKRIYAKTGATGQADLVRMVLTGLAPLA